MQGLVRTPCKSLIAELWWSLLLPQARGWAWLVRLRYLSEPVTEDPQNSGSWPSPLRCNLKYPVHVSQASSKVLCTPAPPSLNVPQMTRSSKPHSKRYINLLPSGLDYADSYFHSSTDQKHQIQPQKKKSALQESQDAVSCLLLTPNSPYHSHLSTHVPSDSRVSTGEYTPRQPVFSSDTLRAVLKGNWSMWVCVNGENRS